MKIIVGITAPLSIILLKGQLKYFSSNGCDVYLLAPKTKETIAFCADESATLLPVDIKRDISVLADLKSLFVIYKYLSNIKPDVVNVGTPKMGFLAMLAAWFLGIPKRIYTCRGFRFEHEAGMKRRILKSLDKLAISKAHHVICISESVKKLGLDEKMFIEKKAVLFGRGSSNGLDLEFFNPELYSEEKKQVLKKRLGIQNKFVFGFVGRIVDRKGINELYNVFLRIKENDKNIHLLVVGKANLEQVADDTLMARLERDEDVTLTGYIDNVNDYMSVMDVFVLPAWWEGFGNTLIQAAAMGLPIISCDVTGCRDAVNNGYNGVLISPKNETELYRVMSSLKHDNSERNRLGNNGKRWARNFDSVTIWEEIKGLYEK